MDLYGFRLTDFNIILGIDWLSKHHAHIDYLKQKISLRGPNRGRVVHKVKPLERGVKLISAIKAQRLLRRGCEGYLCNVVEIEAPETSLKDLPVV